MNCSKHPKYGGVKPPKADCRACRLVYVEKHYPKERSMDVARALGVHPSTARGYAADLGLHAGQRGGASPTLDYNDQALRKDFETLKKRNSLWDAIGDAFIEAVRALPNLPSPVDVRRRPSSAMKEETGVLLISDVQAGSFVSSSGTGNLGGFSTEVLSTRMAKLFGDTAHVLRVYHPNVRRLYVFMLGDIIEGSTIFEGQLRQIDMHTTQQVIYCIDQLARHINNLSGQFDEVRCFCICGNHGRVGKKGVNDPLDNLDYLVYNEVKVRLENNPKVKVKLPTSWFEVVDVMGWNFLLAHGDDILSWLGVPWYGMQRSKYKMQELLLPTPIHYYIIGDKHTAADLFATGLVMNGCFPGGSEFSLKKMQVGGMPSQVLFGVDAVYGKTWSRNLLLEVPSKASKVKISK